MERQGGSVLKKVLKKITAIVLAGSFLGSLSVGVIVFVLFMNSPDIIQKTALSVVASQILFLIPVFLIRKMIKDKIISKLSNIVVAMKEISMGNLDYEIKVEKTGDELEELADSFERMRISMKTIMEKLEKGEI